MKKIAKSLTALIFSATVLSGCATKAADPQDPYEAVNRPTYWFNVGIDLLVYRNVAYVYDYTFPHFAKTGVTNFFDNLGEVTSFPNDIAQGKVNYAFIDLTRFIINSSIGIGGLFDVASHLGLPTHSNDFGITLAFYSDNPKSPYFVIPFLGPSTMRDAFGLGVDTATVPTVYCPSEWVTWGAFGLQLANTRAILLPTDKIIAASFDPYAFVRDAYLQKRNQKIQQARTEHDYHYSRAADWAARKAGKPLPSQQTTNTFVAPAADTLVAAEMSTPMTAEEGPAPKTANSTPVKKGKK